MSQLTDFFKGLFKASDKKSEISENVTTKELDGETVKVSNEEKGFWDKAGEGISAVGNMIGGWFSESFGDAQDVQNELFGLRYKGKEVSENSKKDYINLVSSLDTLKNKSQHTDEELALIANMESELQNYTVPESYDSWSIFDSSRNRDALKSTAPRRAVNTKLILENLGDKGSLARAGLGIQESESDTVMSKDEYEDAVRDIEFNRVIESAKNDAANNMVKNWYIAERNPGGRKSTLDEAMGDLEGALNDRSTVQTLESYKILYRYLKGEDAQHIKDAILKSAQNIIDLNSFMLTSNKTSKEALVDYFNTYGNPFTIDLSIIPSDQMTMYEQDILNASMLGRPEDFFNDRYTENSRGADGYSMANQLLRQVQIRQDVEKGNNLESLWHAAEYTSSLLGGYMSAGVGSVFAGAEMFGELLEGKDLTWQDFDAYLYGWQNSTYMNLKERHQSDYSNINYLGAGINDFAANYGSIADDIGSAYLEAKVCDFPVKLATLKNINSVISKGSKTIKVAETTKKATDTAKKVTEATVGATKTGEKVITTGEKIKDLVKADTMFQRVKNGIKGMLDNWWQNKKAAFSDLAGMSGKDMAMIAGENTVRWIAEETMTSALMQGLTPYDYEESDFIMDLGGALFSGLTRALAFTNGLGKLKLQSNSSVWVSWWLRDVQKISDLDTEKILNKLTTVEIDELGESIKQSMGFVGEQTQKISRTKAKTKAQQLSEGAVKRINDSIKKISDAADKRIMTEFYNSVDSDINRLVKKKKVKGPDGNYTTELQWAGDPKDSKFAKKIEKARAKMFSADSLDNATTVSGMARKIKAIKDNTWKRVNARGKKQGWTKEHIREAYKRTLSRDLKKYGLDRRKALSKAGEKFYGIGPMDEINSWGPMARKLAIYINNFILMKKASKMDLIRGLSILGRETRDCFIAWIQKAYPTKGADWDKYTKEELTAAIKEFGYAYDEAIFPDWNLTQRRYNANGVGAKQPGTYIAEGTYEDAVKENPDLKFMGESLFREIAEDPTLTLEQKEIKFLNYRRTESMSGYAGGKRRRGQYFYGIDDSNNSGFPRRAFNDTYEEKQVFGQEGKIYLKVNEEDDGATVISRNEKNWAHTGKNGNTTYTPTVFDKSQEGVIECTYKKQPVNSWDGHSEYFIYDKRGIHIATIRIDADVDFSRLGKKPAAKDLYPRPRLITVTLLGDMPSGSVEFEVIKDPNSVAKIFSTDIDLRIKEDTVITSEEYVSNGRQYKRESTLKQWNNFSRFISRGETSYVAFQKLIPGYTDRVPENYFNRIIKDKNLSPVDKQNLLMAIMVNKGITITNDGVSIKTGNNVFRRPSYSYQVPVFDDKGKPIRMQTKYVKGDAETFMEDHKEGTILLTMPDGTTEAYYYVLSDKAGEYRLYKELNNKGYAGSLVVGEKSLGAYILEGNKRVWANNVEFIEDVDLNRARKILGERFDDIGNTIIKVSDTGDEAFREIYKKLYGAEMPESLFHKLRSTPNMTPERYLNLELQKFRDSRFGRYIPIKRGSWESIANQIWVASYRVKMAELFVNLYPESALTDAEIMGAINRLINERMRSGGKTQFKFTKAEREIADIMFDRSKKTFSDSELISIYGYSMFGKEPTKMTNPVTLRLRNRRNNILLALFKDKKVLDLTDGEKELLINWAKRRGLTELTEEELINDILNHPETYKGILQALSKSIEEAERLSDTTEEVAELDKINKRLKKIEPTVVTSKPKKKAGKNTKEIRKEISEYQKGEVDSLLEQAKQEIEEAANLGDQQKINAAYSKRSELEEYNERLEEEQNYKDTVGKGGYTVEQFDFLARQRMRGTDAGLIQESPLSQKEVNDRIKDITDRMPGMRIVMVDPITNKVSFRGFTKEEQLKYAEQIKVASQAILDGRANAAHVRELHAIVVNPRLTLSNTLGHEWFHEAISILQDSKWTPKKIDNLFYTTFQKHRDDIESFAEERGYDVEYRDLRNASASEYQRAITEEWLAERFGDYVNNRYNEALELDSDLVMFLRDLWDRMVLMFSDTNAMELFEDIYEGRVDYSDVTIDLKKGDLPTNRFSLLSNEAKAFFDRYDPNNSNIGFGDMFNEYTIRALRDVYKMSSKDLKVGTSNGLVGRGAFASEVKTVLSNGTRASFNDIYESISKKTAITSADNLTDYIYGREFVGDFYTLTEDSLLELKTNGNITREGQGFKVQMKTDSFYPMSQTVSKNKSFVFSIRMGESELFRIDNTTDFIADYLRTLPDTLSGQDWFQGVVRTIMRQLNDSGSKNSNKVSRTAFYHKISKEIQASRTIDTLFDTLQTTITPEELDMMTEALENGIRRGCKQVILPEYEDLPLATKQVMHEAYIIYLFNQFIPHGDRSTDLIARRLFDRKNELTIRLIKYIDVNKPNGVSYYIYNEKKKLPTINILIDIGDGQPRYIGRHLPKDFQRSFEEAGLNNIDIQDKEFKRVTVWNKSLLNTSFNEYAVAVRNMDVGGSNNKEFVMVGESPRMILEKTRSQEFESLVHYQKPAIIDGQKVVFGEDAPDEVLRAAYERGFYQPVTLISEGRHRDNIRFMNNVHKKYNISIENASPETKDKLTKLKDKPKTDIAKRRKILKEYEELKNRKDILETQIRNKDLALKAFQKGQIYQTANRIRETLESNGEAYKAVKEADDAAIINTIEDSYVPYGSINESFEETMSLQPPFGKMADVGRLDLNNPAMRDGVDNLVQYQEVNKTTGAFGKEIDIVEKRSGMSVDEFTIYPVRDGDITNELTEDMLSHKGFVIWAENSKVLNDWKNMFDDKMIVYERKGDNIVYYRNLDYEEPKVSTQSIEELNKTIINAEEELKKINKKIAKAKGMGEVEALIKDKSKIEYLIQKTKDNIEAIDNSKYIDDGKEAVYGTINDSTLICNL